MVVFCDLDDEDPVQEPHADLRFSVTTPRSWTGSVAKPALGDTASAVAARPNPNLNGFSAALGCYPIVAQIARQLDLNSLHDLALTCRQFRANLLQYRDQLVRRTLRCSNESQTLGPRLADRMRQSREAWHNRGGATSLMGSGRIQSGRVGSCARDMVGECRRCAQNCVIKPPPANALNGRYRRLCKTCVKAPIEFMTAPPQQLGDEEDDEASISLYNDEDGHIRATHISATARSPRASHAGHDLDMDLLDTITTTATTISSDATPVAHPAFARGPCTCADSMFICHPCGRTLRSADDTYMHGWKWRTHYSAKLGGLGTGIGEGHEGVKCGRNAACLAARIVEREVECSAAELAGLQRGLERVEVQGLPGRSWEGSSYLAQEIEGVGGGLKMKVKKQVRVGAVVREYEDERKGFGGGFLARERKSVLRGWCAWCDRVVLGVKDLNGPGVRGGSSGSSSGSGSGSDSGM